MGQTVREWLGSVGDRAWLLSKRCGSARAALRARTPNQGICAIDSDNTMCLLARTGDRVTARGATKVIQTLNIFRVAIGVQGQSRNFDAATAHLAN